jgi:hypothetical protein
MRAVMAFAVMCLGVGWTVGVAGQAHDHGAASAPATQSGSGAMSGPAGQKSGMMAEHQAADDRLKALMKAAEEARGDAKVAALTAVVAELVKQHTAMHESMAGMMGRGGMPMGRGRGAPTP